MAGILRIANLCKSYSITNVEKQEVLKGIDMIFQNYNLISHMTLAQNVEIALELSSIDKETRKERALDLLNIVGLKEHADKLPSQLSGGQKQKVAIARALANNPSIILADEPTGALDKESTEDIIQILKRITSMGKLVLVVTHSEQVLMNAQEY